MSDKYRLYRFIEAQQDSYARALDEVKQGRKRSHWMWYIFPQVRGLGWSETSKYYAIQDLQEAIAYLEHPVLGPRLREICEALLELSGANAREIFGAPDDTKLRSSMTLFAAAAPEGTLFQRVLGKFFGGEPDARTLELLY